MATVPIKVDAKQFNKGLSDVKKGLTSILGPLNVVTARLSLLTVGIFGFAAAAGGIGVFAVFKLTKSLISLNKQMISAAAAAEEVNNRFRITFGEGSTEVADQLDSIATATGRSATALRRGASDLGQFFVSMGIGREESGRFAVAMSRIAVDVGSFQDKLDEDVLDRFRSGLVGNAEAVRGLGLNIQEETLRLIAYNAGWTETERQLNSNEKIFVRMLAILQQTTDATNDAIETADSLANIQKRVNASFQEGLATLGGPVADAFRGFITDGVGVFRILSSIELALEFAGVAGIGFFGVLEQITEGLQGVADRAKFTSRAIGLFFPQFALLAGKTTTAVEALERGFEAIDKRANQIELRTLVGQIRLLSPDGTDIDGIVRDMVDLNVSIEDAIILLRGMKDKFRDLKAEDQRQLEAELEAAFRAAEKLDEELNMARDSAARLLGGQFSGPGIVGLRTGFEGISTAVGDSAAGIEKFGVSARRVMQQVISDVIAAAARFQLLNLVVNPLFGPAVAQQLGFRGAAKGMVEPFAAGGFPNGMITSPTVFGLAGEKGPEVGFSGRQGRAIAPLERDPGTGALGVRMVGGTGGGPVSFSNTFVFGQQSSQDAARMSARQVEMQMRGVIQRVR